jgi:hypothetical protein
MEAVKSCTADRLEFRSYQQVWQTTASWLLALVYAGVVNSPVHVDFLVNGLKVVPAEKGKVPGTGE